MYEDDNFEIISLIKKKWFASLIDELNSVYHELTKKLTKENKVIINIFSEDPIVWELLNQITIQYSKDDTDVLIVFDDENNYLFETDEQLDQFIAKQVWIWYIKEDN